ncbi:hypothetical protein EGH21_10800 [Halomicroarcula sp. F13]|uniref:Uncharacterized protein n=1 Tax=Haloarcula rubra TaxID=2487747 RepID=A0AAW4PT63_9EURY|nr:hypothetical protein [Halomicroarcula rubra]MBX0323517.1 hypothetical protein [Halomicroarcula rubra]
MESADRTRPHFELTAEPPDVDTEPLASFAATVEAQYRALAERMEAADEESVPDDRMYM